MSSIGRRLCSVCVRLTLIFVNSAPLAQWQPVAMRDTLTALRFILLNICALSVAACAEVYRMPEQEAREPLATVRPQETTRAQLAREFGTPHSTYEQGRIAVYPVSLERGKLAPVEHGQPDFYLVVVYGADDTVVRRSLVRVR